MYNNSYIRWIIFLEKETDRRDSPFIKFSVLWFSLASFLSDMYKDDFSEQKKIEKFNKDFSHIYTKIVEEDKKFKKKLLSFSMTKKPTRKFVDNLQTNQIEDRDYFLEEDIDDFLKFLSVIYQIKCNFFHGGKDPFNREDEMIAKWAYDVLLYFWKYLLINKLERPIE